ncbi:hypothetical protein CHX26_12435 [Porphyrobacter sp. HT-58-2]|uniref:MAE_28990/MAE_18760 family HEPN-like nuclease n=1 Tax=Porphyrobacter sp. HT-58-2 TaxID=2023229 RepID=UPI000CDC3C1C|nr:MAE_28990/MAE_18760 family HEPN-like nuclease [Porphyrobacter sp. HT-58-2]AUX70189.1 hypothetical protein CHX26_12435 [Porphyrobacter sp. HT-58-2]
MSKPYTAADFGRQIVEDRNWRIREVSDLVAAIQRADALEKRVLLRALVTICYAHWEGYVRFAAKRYLEHISLRKFPYKDLDRQFLRNYFLPRLESSSKSFAERCQIIDDVLSSSDVRFTRVNADLVSTRSNLNFEVFKDICLVCGIDSEPFSEKSTFIDVVLLKRRNSIAHGEGTLIEMQDLHQVSSETIALMRLFGDTLENSVVLESYRAA